MHVLPCQPASQPAIAPTPPLLCVGKARNQTRMSRPGPLVAAVAGCVEEPPDLLSAAGADGAAEALHARPPDDAAPKAGRSGGFRFGVVLCQGPRSRLAAPGTPRPCRLRCQPLDRSLRGRIVTDVPRLLHPQDPAAAAAPGQPSASSDDDGSAVVTYELFSVLVHSGAASSGHYFVYIRDLSAREEEEDDDGSATQTQSSTTATPDYRGEPRWLRFDDDKVSHATAQQVEGTFGRAETAPRPPLPEVGSDPETRRRQPPPPPQHSLGPGSSSTTAYMLLYRRRRRSGAEAGAGATLSSSSSSSSSSSCARYPEEGDIPRELRDAIAKEEAARARERAARARAAARLEVEVHAAGRVL
eukprot:COSAG01_NODE_2754_length_7138_cov_16.469953_11_plen_358_part_00